ncbi:MAG: tetratricopeptide repeat protein [Deltaproteobacteria bacterium]|nr:tetratricopeptide repeat protein [Deltaproteobacteria bacterium]
MGLSGSMDCPKCRHPNTDAAKFCENCGAPLVRAPRFCFECGLELSDQAKFCPNCGRRQDAGEPSESDASDSQHHRRSQIERTVRSFTERGSSLLTQGLSEEARAVFESALEVINSRYGAHADDPSVSVGHARIYNGIADVHSKLGDYDTALEWLSKALDSLDGIEDTQARIERATVRQLTGWTLFRQGDMRNAAAFYCYGIIDLSENVETKTGAMLYQGLGIIFREMGDYTQARDYMERCRQIRVKLTDDVGVAIVSNNLGNLYVFTGELTVAEEHYTNSLRLSQQLNDLEGVAICNANLGYIQYENGKYDLAEDYLLTAVRMAEGKWPWIIPTCYGYLTRNNVGAGRLSQARAYLKKADEALAGKDDVPVQATLMELEALLAFHEGDRRASIHLFDEACPIMTAHIKGFHSHVFLLNFGRCILGYVADPDEASNLHLWRTKASELIGRATDGFSRIGNRKYLLACHQLLDEINRAWTT